MGGSGQGGNPNAAGGQLGQMANSQTKDPMQNLNRQGAPNFKGPSQQPAQQPYGAVMRDGRIGPDGRVQGRGNDNKFPGQMGDFGLRGIFNPPGQGDAQFMQPMPMRHTGNVGYGLDGKPIGGQEPGSQYGGYASMPQPYDPPGGPGRQGGGPRYGSRATTGAGYNPLADPTLTSQRQSAAQGPPQVGQIQNLPQGFRQIQPNGPVGLPPSLANPGGK